MATATLRNTSDKDPQRSIDLKQLVDTLVLRGISLPVLIRFAGILQHRLGELHSAFATAIAEHHYQGQYCCVYPIKVNQQRHGRRRVLEFGRPLGSTGSWVEARIDRRHDRSRQRDPIVCNNQGRWTHRDGNARPEAGAASIPVVEKYTELPLILKYSERVGVRPTLGLRVKLASRGSEDV